MRQVFEPQDWDLGLKAGIWASRLGYGPGGWDTGLEAEIWAWWWGGGTKENKKEEEEKEKIPLCESIGHQPLWGHCIAPTLNYNHDLPKHGTGTADHLTLLRLLLIMQNHFSKYPCWRDR